MKFINIQNIAAFISLIFLLILFIEENNFLFFTLQNLSNLITTLQHQNKIMFLISFIVINFFYFLTPLPTFPIIIANGFVFREFGFFLSYFIVITCSLILFKFSKKIKKFFKKKTSYSYLAKIKKKNIEFLLYIILSTRYFIPYFFHNLLFGFILKKTKYFFFSIIIAEIPIIYFLNRFGTNIKSISHLNEINLENILKLEYILTILLFFLIILGIIVLQKYFNKIIKS